jgi:hypothetical protein
VPGFADARAALVDAAFAEFGVASLWRDVEQIVPVRLRSGDVDERFGGAMLVERPLTARFRRLDIASPAIGDEFMIEEGDDAGVYAITGRPMLDAKGVWACSIEKRQEP